MGKSSQAKTRAEVKKALEMFAENPALTFTDVSHALGYTHSAVSHRHSANSFAPFPAFLRIFRIQS